MANPTSTPTFDPEQASMFAFDGPDAMEINDFTWSRIEQRIAELAQNSRLVKNSAGLGQKVPFSIAERPERTEAKDKVRGLNEAKGAMERQLEYIVVIAISCNNYACEHNLPFQFRYSFAYGGTKHPVMVELYMIKSTWTVADRQAWTAAPAFRRKHLCSVEGPWTWATGGKVLRVPFIPVVRVPKQLDPLPSPDNGRYRIRLKLIPTHRRLTTLVRSHYHLRHQDYQGSLALLLLKPQELRLATEHNARAYDIPDPHEWQKFLVCTVPETRRCVHVRCIVDNLADAYEGRGGLPAANLEEWGPIREACVRGLVYIPRP